MKTATRHLTFNTPNRRELIRITEEVQAVVAEARNLSHDLRVRPVPPGVRGGCGTGSGAMGE
jgi:hypothetical protein